MNVAIGTRDRQRPVLEQLVDDRRAPVEGQARVRERHAQVVVALDDPREPKQLVFDLVEVTLGRDDVEERLGVDVDAVSHRASCSRPG